jgi:hypothetical protein
VPAPVAVVGECCCSCVFCGRPLASKGHYPVTFAFCLPMYRSWSDGCSSVPVRA